MPVYEYTALDKKGKNRKGIIDADSSVVARQKLRNSELFPVEVNKTSSKSKSETSAQVSVSSFLRKVNTGELSAMTRQLSILLGAGITLFASLDTIVGQVTNPLLKKVMAQIKDSVNEGNSFASSIAQYPKFFSPIYINMVRAGEASGSLDLVLDRLAEFSEHQEALKGRFKAALAYPIFMCVIGVLVLFILLTFIVPNITEIFSDMQQALPLPTILLLNTSAFLKSFWWLVLILLAIVIITLRQFKRTAKGTYLWDEFKLRVPVLGQINIKMAIARFGRTLGSLLQSGVPLITALRIVRNIVNNSMIADVIDEAIVEIQSGKGLSVTLGKSRWIPPVSVQMISVGEQSGDLEKMFNKIADIYEREVESRVMAMTSMLEPVMIIVMGLIVAFIVVSILLPIFEMSQMIK